jgi:Glycosyl hydrolases family 16
MWTTTDSGTTRPTDAPTGAEARSGGPRAGLTIAAVALATLTALVVAPVGPSTAAARPSAPSSVTAEVSADRSALLRAVERPVLVDGFQDLSGWSVYNGIGSYSTQGPRVRTNVEVRHEGGRQFARVWTRPLQKAVTIGGRTLRAGEMAAGGMSHRLGNRTYGRWTMQMRAGSSTNTRVAVMLWGVGSWPAAGELDFFESGADQGTRQAMNVTNHWAGPDGRNAQSMRTVTADFTRWHDWEIVWSPRLYTVSVDGVEVARYTQHVPSGKMFLAVQTAIAGGSPARAGTTSGYVDVANLKIYARG